MVRKAGRREPLPAPPATDRRREAPTPSGGAGGASAFDRAYSIVVGAKALYGSVELFVGCVLLCVPDLAGKVLTAIALELAEGGVTLRVAASHAVAAASTGVASGAAPLAAFLLVHGGVKLLTAYALLRRAIRWYPWALGALMALLVVQAVELVNAPTPGSWILALLDVAVVALVIWEYRRLRADRAQKPVDGDRPAARPGAGAPSTAAVAALCERRAAS